MMIESQCDGSRHGDDDDDGDHVVMIMMMRHDVMDMMIGSLCGDDGDGWNLDLMMIDGDGISM